MLKKHILFFALFSALLSLTNAMAQGADTTAAGSNEIIDLDAEVYKIPVEAPQVKLLTDRIKPEFDSVHLDKSFRKEIAGGGERFILEPVKKGEEFEKVDTGRLLNRKR